MPHPLHDTIGNGGDGLGVAYYNEIDPFAAAWLRELIADGHIAPGEVDERSIEDVRPDELAGFTQCHFFAGIGVHSLALRRAGWSDDRPIWTGSCPCQPFSAAGKGEGFADERHLWPAFFHLIEQCEPAIVAGEQVASGGTGVWFDLVQADLEAMGYAFGLVPLPAAGFGGAHIRDRAFWVGDASSSRPAEFGRQRNEPTRLAATSISGGLAHDIMQQRPGSAPGGDEAGGRVQEPAEVAGLRGDGRLANIASGGRISGAGLRDNGSSEQRRIFPADSGRHGQLGHNSRPSAPMLGRDAADWLFCRDGRWRPVEPGTLPLAHEAPARVGRLRGYGNAIDAVVAEEFYRALIDILAEA